MKWPIIISILLVFPLSYFITGIVRKHALRTGLLDVPNARSSHKKITPRGGGLAIALLFILAVGVFGITGTIPAELAIALFGGGILVSLVGWLDDRYNLRASVRGMVHLAAALWAVFWLGGLSSINVGVTVIPMGLAGSVAAVIGVMWAINFYNFMDGIDGIAASEAIVVGLVGGALELIAGAQSLAVVSGLLALASAGFLLWNWPPAKIFMGDVGSGLLGFSFAVISIASENYHGTPLLIWVLLLGVFVVDATVTLIRRIRCGQRWYEPHRTHAYQLAVQSGYSHKQVTMAVLWLNLGLAILAIITLRVPLIMPWLFLISVTSLLMLHYMAVNRFEQNLITLADAESIYLVTRQQVQEEAVKSIKTGFWHFL